MHRCGMVRAMFAHIAGVPIEETALSLAPVVLAAGGLAGLRLRIARQAGKVGRAHRGRKEKP